ncbi:chondroadherin [Drosophila ficusphila]|uniref:chondroadherin n=1 Tax=Drosophila ficusphila TaxID=30025 RepID=UPI0007E86087|nr:chondroadherin [Drosophila ficusphila]
MCNSWLLLIIALSVVVCLWNSQQTETSQSCPAECICLSQTQVLCNTGGLEQIPLRQLPASVENLALTKNNFPIIKPDSFSGLRALKKLSLDGNNITRIKQFAFRGLPRLKELSIQYTPLQMVAAFAFAGLQNLSTILLSHNQIQRIEGNAFAGTSNIKLILLTNNPLIRIDSSAFSSLTNVGHLILPSGIRSIEQDAFFGMDTVGLLKLAYMDLKEVAPFTFRGLSNVLLLTLQESDLGVICADAFTGLTQVETLQVLNNKIDSIEELNFTSSAAIKHLKFFGNHVLETPDPNAIIVDGVEHLQLVSNHFPCGCHIHTLLDGPLAEGAHNLTDFLQKNYCISPLEVNGRVMSELDIDSIGRCSDQLTKGNLGSSAASLALGINSMLLIAVASCAEWRHFRLLAHRMAQILGHVAWRRRRKRRKGN